MPIDPADGGRPSRAGRVLALALVLAVATGAAARWLGPAPLVLDLGAFEGEYTSGSWTGSLRAALDPQAVQDGVTSFYHRAARPGAELALPAFAPGPATLTFRARAAVRSNVSVFASGVLVGQFLAGTGPWQAYGVPLPPGTPTTQLALAFRPLPLVTGQHVGNPELLVDTVTLAAPGGLRFGLRACATLAAVPVAVLLLALLAGARERLATALAVVAALLAFAFFQVAALPTLLAVPRLAPAAMLAAFVTAVLLRRASIELWDRRALAVLVGAGVLVHGALVFLPDHNPPDIEIHVRRARDLGTVPLEYQAWLRYGSQLPTVSQTFGQATAALGEATLIPYSPLPYFAYYAVHAVGLDLQWALTVLGAMVAMGAAPVLWLAALRIWDRRTAWLAALLYTLDLAVWHHLGRSHAPAVFGNAIGVAALAHLAASAEDVRTRRGLLTAAALLALAALGYSSMVVLVGLFGLVLLLFLAVDAKALGAEGRRGLAAALALGGLLAGVLFYFHYVPGLLRGATGVEAEVDLFPGKTVLLFRNESRQSLRVWAAGFALPLLAGLLAAPLAIRRARASAQPLLASWLLSWALVMVFKDPALLPKLLRWAKEDQYISPLLCLTIAAAVAGVPWRAVRWALIFIVLGTAFWLQQADFRHHADTLTF